MNCHICNHEDHAKGEPCQHPMSETRKCLCTKEGLYRAISVPMLGRPFEEQMAQLEAVAAALMAAGIRVYDFVGHRTIINPVNEYGHYLDRKVIVAFTDDANTLSSLAGVEEWNAKVSQIASHTSPVVFSSPAGTVREATMS